MQNAETKQSPGAQGQACTERKAAENFHEFIHCILVARNLFRASLGLRTTAKIVC